LIDTRPSSPTTLPVKNKQREQNAAASVSIHRTVLVLLFFFFFKYLTKLDNLAMHDQNVLWKSASRSLSKTPKPLSFSVARSVARLSSWLYRTSTHSRSHTPSNLRRRMLSIHSRIQRRSSSSPSKTTSRSWCSGSTARSDRIASLWPGHSNIGFWICLNSTSTLRHFEH
jgi:hypothetical protein